MTTYNTTRRTNRWGRAHLLLIAVVLALMAAACVGASDEPVGDASAAGVIVAADRTTADEEPAAEQPAADEPTGDDLDVAPASVEVESAPFDVVINGEIVFNEDGSGDEGTFAVTTGAAELGCDGGTNLESGSSAGVEKLWTCTSGSRSGTITVVFLPPAGTWEVTDASGDFRGLVGDGDWSGEVAADGSAGADTLTGSMRFGEVIAREPLEDEDSAPAEPATNDLLPDAVVIDPTALPFTVRVDTTKATSDADDENVGCPAPQTGASVWYSFTPTVDMEVTVDADGSDFPAGISVVSGEPGSFELIECRPFAFTVAAEANTTYHFQVFDGESASSPGGTLVFGVDEVERASTAGLEPLGQDFVQLVANEIDLSFGAFMFAVVDAEGQSVVGSNGEDRQGNAPTADDVFRVGSITNVFTSLATLTLVEEGVVDLDAPAADYISRVPVASEVTVRDLLRHTSGIFSYTDVEGFFPTMFDEPDRVWTAEDVVELVADEPPVFEPGSEFGYSNTNYILLGVLIEEVTGHPYHEVVRERLLDPLGLRSTYLAGFEDGPEVFHPYEHLGNRDFDYTSIATSAWAAGAMVSSADDLHQLFTALFDGGIVSSDLVAEMIDGTEYGLGLELGEAGEGLYGHGGSIPGYGTFVRHSPELGVTAFLVSTDEGADSRYAYGQLFEGFAALTAE